MGLQCAPCSKAVSWRPGGSSKPSGDLNSAIDATFGDFEKMKAAVKAAGLGRFGSGWAWLGVGKDKKLAVFSTANQDSPHMEGAKGVVGIDVWEHAYYLKYRNLRAKYVEAWWSVANWDVISENYAKAAKG